MNTASLRACGATFAALCIAGALLPQRSAEAAATLIINNINAPGVGFNDPTPVAPIAGNFGTTLGQQRLVAFTYAANLWGATLTSNVPIVINAQFTALSCTATAAVLGSAGATSVFRDWPGVPRAGTWYSYALTNKLRGVESNTTPGPQINANFNVNLGQANCLAGGGWYYGLDSNEPAGFVDLVAVLQHELGHGLGFQTFTNGSTGAFLAGFPSVWDHFLFDAANSVLWTQATAAQRAASAISVDQLVWTGANVNGYAPNVLRAGTPGALVSGPAAGPLAGTTLPAGESSFGAPLTAAGLYREVMPVATPTGGGPGCGPLTLADARAVLGKIALIDRGVCAFTVKVKNAQNAGASGVLIANNVAGAQPLSLGGADPTVTITAAGITLDAANALKLQMQRRSRTNSGVFALLASFGTQLAGADANGRLKLFAPNPFQAGSSVSHFDVTATPNLLMEPTINSNLGQSVVPPNDLTFPLLQDIGW